MSLINVLLMAPSTGASGSGNNPIFTIGMMVMIVVVFYFFFIRPQSKKNKELKRFRESLKKGDKVITAGGVHGKILEVNETTVIIETEGQGRLKIEKLSVSSIIPGSE
ncbi:MAG: preprotein translocase subunit YajC [Bacteroidota bacterium]